MFPQQLNPTTILKYAKSVSTISGAVLKPKDLAIMSYNLGGNSYDDIQTHVSFPDVLISSDSDDDAGGSNGGADDKSEINKGGYDFFCYACMANPISFAWFILCGVSLIALRGYVKKAKIEKKAECGVAYCVKGWEGNVCHAACNWKHHDNKYITVSNN